MFKNNHNTEHAVFIFNASNVARLSHSLEISKGFGTLGNVCETKFLISTGLRSSVFKEKTAKSELQQDSRSKIECPFSYRHFYRY